MGQTETDGRIAAVQPASLYAPNRRAGGMVLIQTGRGRG